MVKKKALKKGTKVHAWIKLEDLSDEDSDYKKKVKEINLLRGKQLKPKPKKMPKIHRQREELNDKPPTTYRNEGDSLKLFNGEFILSSDPEDSEKFSDEEKSKSPFAVDSELDSDDEPIFRTVRHPITGFAKKLRSDVVKKIEKVYELKRAIAVNDAAHLHEQVEKLEDSIRNDGYIYAKFIEGL